MSTKNFNTVSVNLEVRCNGWEVLGLYQLQE